MQTPKDEKDFVKGVLIAARNAEYNARSGRTGIEALQDTASEPDYHACDVLDAAFTQGQADCFVNALSIALVPKEVREKNRRIAVVRDPFIYVKRTKSDQFAILTPPGYETDFASIPAIAQWLIAPFGRHAEAAVVHDWLYSLGEKANASERKQADSIFLEALKYLGVDPVRRLLMYCAVRLGGAKAFGRSDEYNDRFRDVATLERTSRPPYSKAVMRKYALCKRSGGGEQQ